MDIKYLSLFCLVMTFATLWIRRSIVLWGSFLVLALSLAIYSGQAQPFSLLVVAILFVLFWILKNPIAGIKRHVLTLIALAIGAGLNYHWIPGFASQHPHIDKPLMGLFPLTFLLPLCQTRQDWIKMGLKTAMPVVVGIFGLATLALATGVVEWQVKILPHFLLRLVFNLFLTVIPEEAFFRGFLQKEISQQIGKGIIGKAAGIVAASALFTLCHLAWTSSPAMLALVFVAGALYGLIYELSGYLEGSIICHFAVNLLHMIFFSYHTAAI